MTDRILTRQEMILLHLLQYIDVTPNGYTMPFAQTQDGIGMAAGMSRSYVATVVGILEDKGFVAWVSTHPKGSRVRMRAYYLLPPGIRRAKEISARLEEREVPIEDVIEHPGSTARDANIARAVMELEQAAESARASGDDLSRIRMAIAHASMAINHLSKEAMWLSLFRTGEIVTTNGIDRAMMLDHRFLEAVRECLERHCLGDWGDACEETRQQNDEALKAEKNGKLIDSLFSVYDIDGTEIFIITEIDRSVTTILFPEEY